MNSYVTEVLIEFTMLVYCCCKVKGTCRGCQVFAVGEYPSNTVGQIAGVAGLGEVATLLVLDHVGEATDGKGDDGGAAGEGFEYHVGEVVLHRGRDEEIGGGVELCETHLVVEVAHRVGGQTGERRGGHSPKDDGAGMAEVPICPGLVQRSFKLGRAFTWVGEAIVSPKEEQIAIQGQAQGSPRRRLGLRVEAMQIEAIGDDLAAVLGQDRAATGARGHPLAGCN